MADALIPVRVACYFAVAVTPEEFEDGAHFDRIWDATADLDGVFAEGGGASIIKPGDLVDGSPLDRYLATAQDGKETS